MKKILALCMAGMVILAGVAVYATGGTTSDPLVTVDYINDTYGPSLDTAIESSVSAATSAAYNQALAQLTASYESQLSALTQDGIWNETRVKEGDSITMSVGSSIILYSGSATFTTSSSGVIINVTTGQTVSSGSALVAMERYIIGENTTAAVMISSDTAVINTSGTVTYNSSSQTDYNALANALYEAGMFKGTDLGYGSGYELERAPTRTEGLIMFLRMLGEEEAALCYTGTCPFVDSPTWCQSYLAYAYDMGYTNGIGTDSNGNMIFGVNNTLSARDYITFILRALDYDDSATVPDFTWSEAAEFALSSGVITQGEYEKLTTEDFLRAQVVYLSYFSLTTSMNANGQTLLNYLDGQGSLDSTLITTIMAKTGVNRIA